MGTKWTNPQIALTVTPQALRQEIGAYFMVEELSNPPEPFAGTADWAWGWNPLLEDAVEIAESNNMIYATFSDAGTALNKLVPVVLVVHTDDQDLVRTVEACEEPTGTVLATVNYTEPIAERPERGDSAGTWAGAADDATHALVTVIADLNAVLAGPPQQQN